VALTVLFGRHTVRVTILEGPVGPADNLYRVDSLPVPYVFHAFDISGSVFNENILRSFNLYPSGYGPEYANVTGGVFDIALRDPKISRSQRPLISLSCVPAFSSNLLSPSTRQRTSLHESVT